ncbi:MAG: hypothetical protein LBD23_02005, partial [Oscillospiraceae bacterium]|nr:hypothetical protein [Oscillospiraceae bacterium]
MEQKKKMIGSKSSIVYFLFFMSATAMLILAVIFSLYIRRMEQTVEESVQNHLRAAANYASTFITAEELELFHTVDDMERPEWDEIRGRLMQFAEDNQVLYVYYWRYLGNGQLQYIIDNDEDEDWMVTPELILDVDEDQTTADAVPQILAGETWVSELEVYTSMWGGLFSGVAPVFDADGNVYCAAGVDVSDEIIVYMRNTIRTMQFAMIIALIVSVISGLFGMLLYRRKAIQSTIASITKSQFLSTMSHEIRTPMNAILGITELQLLNDNLDQNVRDGLEKIYTSGDMLLSIINDILDLSKIEAGKLEMLIASYDTSSLISETVQLNVMRIGSKPINFELQIDENLPVFLSGDELRIKQILNNVLSNAFKYTLEGTVSFKISVETATNKDAADEVIVSFTVSDTGQGMTKEQVDKLFDEYSQFNMEANRKTEGTGLGLSITRNLIRMMRGTIAIESEAEKGS